MPASVIYIDPTAPAGGNGSLANPYNAWSQVPPGASDYLLKTGTTLSGVVYLGASFSGSSGHDTLVASYLPDGSVGGNAGIAGIVDIDGGSYIGITDLTVSNPGGSALAFQSGAHDNIAVSLTLRDSAVGVLVSDSAGGNNIVYDSTVSNMSLLGFALGNAGPNNEMVGNTVSNIGRDGFEISGNGYNIGDNTITNTGTAIGGTAAIHVYSPAGSALAHIGFNNIIYANTIIGAHDSTGQDGEGVLLDRFTGNNLVVGNHVSASDGSGIAVYMSNANQLFNNVLTGDGLNPGHSHSILAELALNGGVTGNTVIGNTLAPTVPGVAPTYSDQLSQAFNLIVPVTT